MNWSELDQLINDFQSEVEKIDPIHTRWKPIWDSIRTITTSFKQARYPTRSEKDQAWNRFQQFVEKVKEAQSSAQRQHEQFVDASERLKNKILSIAYAATVLVQLRASSRLAGRFSRC